MQSFFRKQNCLSRKGKENNNTNESNLPLFLSTKYKLWAPSKFLVNTFIIYSVFAYSFIIRVDHHNRSAYNIFFLQFGHLQKALVTDGISPYNVTKIITFYMVPMCPFLAMCATHVTQNTSEPGVVTVMLGRKKKEENVLVESRIMNTSGTSRNMVALKVSSHPLSSLSLRHKLKHSSLSTQPPISKILHGFFCS
jgi:hypothetical protein